MVNYSDKNKIIPKKWCKADMKKLKLKYWTIVN